MERVDLSKPQFTQAQVLKCVPALSARTLQNWTDPSRNLIRFPRPGRQGKVLWSALQIVKLAFMAQVVRLGIPPRVALGLADDLKERAVRVHATHPVDEDGGRLSWPIAYDQQDRYHRGSIFLDGDRHRMIIHGRDLAQYRGLLPDAYVTVECDRIVVGCLNRIYAVVAGIDPLGGTTILDDEAASYHRTRLWVSLEAEGQP